MAIRIQCSSIQVVDGALVPTKPPLALLNLEQLGEILGDRSILVPGLLEGEQISLDHVCPGCMQFSWVSRRSPSGIRASGSAVEFNATQIALEIPGQWERLQAFLAARTR